MKVKKTYIADDGKEFSSLKAAKEYEAGLKLKKFVQANASNNDYVDHIYSFIRDHQRDLHDLLSAIKNSMRGVKE